MTVGMPKPDCRDDVLVGGHLKGPLDCNEISRG